MSKLENSIGWCDDTGNKVIGCTKVSEGCKNCYAEIGTIARVLRSRAENPIETWGAGGSRIAVGDFTAKLKRLNKLCICDQCHETYPRNALPTNVLPCVPPAEPYSFSPAGKMPGSTLRCQCGGGLRRIRLFADSNSDWLDEAWPIETFAEFLDELRHAPNVDVLLLTKRIENFRPQLQIAWRMLAHRQPVTAMWIRGWETGEDIPAHVWLGVSVENQRRADERIPWLVQTPAAVRFLSCEPLLESLNLIGPFEGPQAFPLGMAIRWVIVGGESGKHRRDCGAPAIRWVANQCLERNVPVYVKQDCAFKSGQQGRIPDEIWKLKQFPNPRAAARPGGRTNFSQSGRQDARQHVEHTEYGPAGGTHGSTLKSE